MHKARVLDIQTKFKTVFIVQKLKEHSSNHIKDYEKAMDVYRADMKQAITTLSQICEYATDKDMESIKKGYYNLTSIIPPIDQSEMYNSYISLFESSADEEITISMVDANCIINDSWDWAVSAKTTNAMYSSRF